MKLKLKQRAFLAAYAEVCTIQEAARAAKVARRSHYYWLHEPEYAAVFAEVKEEVLDMLLAEARRRAVEGVEEPVFYQGKLCYQNEVDPKTGQMRTTKQAPDEATVQRHAAHVPAQGRETREVPR